MANVAFKPISENLAAICRFRAPFGGESSLLHPSMVNGRAWYDGARDSNRDFSGMTGEVVMWAATAVPIGSVISILTF